MCIFVAQNNLEKTFRLYLFLKLLYKHGNTKLEKTEIRAISHMMGYADMRSVNNHIKELEKLKWIRKNEKTRYYHLYSFDEIRILYGWDCRVAINCTIKEVSNIYATIGAAIYSYQHIDFWRKVKREKSVCLKGRTYHFFSSSFNYKLHFAPVATTGINSLYDISISKASFLKQEAFKHGYIKVKKDFQKLSYSEEVISFMINHVKEFPKNVIQKGGKFHLQLIDLILPCIDMKKRRKLVT